MVRCLLFLVHFYQRAISAYRNPRCRFVPSCSTYMADALSEQGAWTGLQLGLKRILKCHPWGSSGFDPVTPHPSRTLHHQEQ